MPEVKDFGRSKGRTTQNVAEEKKNVVRMGFMEGKIIRFVLHNSM